MGLQNVISDDQLICEACKTKISCFKNKTETDLTTQCNLVGARGKESEKLGGIGEGD